MKKVIVTLAVTLFVLTGFSGAGYAQAVVNPGQSPNHIEHPKRGDGLAKKLNLTEQQSLRAKEMREQSREKIKPIIDELKAERQKLVDLIQSNASQQDIQNQKIKVKELMTKAREIHKQNLAEFEQILTPEQKTQFQELKKQRKAKMQEMRKKHKGQKFKNFGENKQNWQDEK